MLEEIPVSCLVDALSYLTHKSGRLAWFGSLCRRVRGALSESSSWRHLCERYWYVTEERLKEWPTLSPHGVYRALEQWAPLEGYYVLAPAFPWGLLVLVRIAEGSVVADVLRFLPRETSADAEAAAARGASALKPQQSSHCSDDFVEVRVPLFRVSLSEHSQRGVLSAVHAHWLPDAHMVEISDLDPDSIQACTEIAAMYWRNGLDIVRQGAFTARRALRIRAAAIGSRATEDGTGASDARAAEDSSGEEEDLPDGARFCMSSEWRPGHLSVDEPEMTRRTRVMLRHMLDDARVPCDLALIRSPEQFAVKNPSLPRIRPGLYVGDYGHEMYGQYRTEVLLLEYVELSSVQLRAEADAPSLLFARPSGGDPPEELASLLQLDAAVTFVRGTKQCGDEHVPMGATTFVALCGPPETQRLLYELCGKPEPRSVLSRQTGGREEVVRAWRGWGTLAMVGFGHPSWAGGWLVQLCNSSSTEDHRFGFVWDRNQDAVVLHWIVTQDFCPFLQRGWLPEDLR